MNNEAVSDKQGIALIILFIIGSSSIVVPGLPAKKDVWLAIILSVIMALPMAIIASRLHVIFPGKDIFDIVEICFGKFIGKLLILIFSWFVFKLAAEVLRNSSQFLNASNLTSTPLIVPMICTSTFILYIVKKGLPVMGKFAEFVLIFPVTFIFVITFLLIPEMNIYNVVPVLEEGMGPVIKGALGALSFPFGQTVLFSMLFSIFNEKKSPYKIYISGLLIGGLLLLITSLTNILVLGFNTASSLYFPSVSTATRINILGTLQRLEIIPTLTFIIGQYLKISILILCACKGLSKTFDCEDYRFIATPICFLMVSLCYTLHGNIMEFYEWVAKVLPYSSLPVQVFIPILIWIIAEIKKKQPDRLS
ncbi:GerAB/ArcD/ProY family transporter [Oceanirhabdus sp. W0125-5]|uniref:GerAB/ArcD/ProY family transporter n=1 Tax=Oceanirhabdus sp. W0125-5 TaxID=2999116 RepID=UPI0022F2BDB2|nr:endospore germination permease [Oceanirhabdus sp. W0125-5]WBW95646.1 endospore germination permease [Oceanirhabdus sp. W0125-5]